MVCSLGVVVSSCGSDNGGSKTVASGVLGTPFVGTVDGTNAFVALAVKDGQVWAYVCDGEGKPVEGIASYLVGSANGNALAATEADSGAAIAATIQGTKVTGTFTIAGAAPASFVADLATGDAGWFALSTGDEKGNAVGSWIRLVDGRVRGKVVAVTGSSGGDSGANAPEIGDGGGVVPPNAPPVADGALRCYLRTRDFFKVLHRDSSTKEELAAASSARKEACGL